MRRLGSKSMSYTLATRVEESDYLEFIEIARLSNEPNSSFFLRKLIKEAISNCSTTTA